MQMRDRNIAPICLPLDPAEGSLGLLFRNCVRRTQEALTRLAGPDVARLREQLPWHLQEEDLAEAVIEAAVTARYSTPGDRELVHPSANDRVLVAHRDLLARMDDDGLLDVGGLDARPSTIIHAGSALHYHPLLRRYFTSGINQDLIGTLIRAGGQPDSTVRIAIDTEHFTRAEDFRDSMEKDYWWGPALSSEALDDPLQTGVTVHADPDSGLTHEYPRFFVDWRRDKEGRKVVQMEELSDEPSSTRSGLRLLRYLHAIRDTDNAVFVHCDGAVRAYDPDSYTARCEKQYVTGRESATHYRKLFRVDGAISTQDWSDIVARWFRHNRLASEYLKSGGVQIPV
ncbi:hypothetical protein BN11_4600003 [Nostocoides australiense Ben110]|uniref:Uncharacterized protein n=2 Tax=Nostocoides australiense TaxID=99480 RepID=W6K0R0_9MICO|nr:hypothetical protein BN11_4600003 [Tetrasphaera australiensis Ben110]